MINKIGKTYVVNLVQFCASPNLHVVIIIIEKTKKDRINIIEIAGVCCGPSNPSKWEADI